jgi:hypothetical protein
LLLLLLCFWQLQYFTWGVSTGKSANSSSFYCCDVGIESLSIEKGVASSWSVVASSARSFCSLSSTVDDDKLGLIGICLCGVGYCVAIEGRLSMFNPASLVLQHSVQCFVLQWCRWSMGHRRDSIFELCHLDLPMFSI